MGIVQGLTEFLPVSSSGHLIIVPYLLGWNDPFITSLAFSVMLHVGTLVALLVYFRRGLGRGSSRPAWRPIRDRSFGDDPDRRLAWLLVAATIPAAHRRLPAQRLLRETLSASAGPRRGDARRRRRRSCGSPTGGAARPSGARRRARSRVAVGDRRRAGARAHPGHQPLGDLDLGRPVRRPRPRGAARFSFLMATPITAGAALFEARKLVARRGRRRGRASGRCSSGMVAAFVSGMLAIAFLLRYLRTHSLDDLRRLSPRRWPRSSWSSSGSLGR